VQEEKGRKKKELEGFFEREREEKPRDRLTIFEEERRDRKIETTVF
jgi:hypothetical protein